MKILSQLSVIAFMILAFLGRALAVPLLPLAFSPTALVFPTTTLGDSAASLTVAVGLSEVAERVGPISLQLSDPIHFEIVSDTCSGATLENTETCEVSAAFHPDAFGHYSSFLVLLGENGSLGNFVPLEGIGAEAGFIPTPDPTSPPSTSVSLSETFLDFGDLSLGETSPAQSTTLTNAGNTDLFVKAVTFGGDAPFSFAIVETCSLRPVAPGEPCSVTVYFSPVQDGLQKAALAVSANEADGPQILTLNGGIGSSSASGGGCALAADSLPQNAVWLTWLGISLLVFLPRRRLQ